MDDALKTTHLPTPMALAARRLNSVGIDDEANAFLLLSSLAESAIKLIGIAVYAAAKDDNPDDAYRWGYSYVRDSGLGSWDRALAEAVNSVPVSLLPKDYQDLTVWATKKRKTSADPWFFAAKAAASDISNQLGLSGCPDPSNARGLVSLAVFLRNKTKGHGALGPEFFASCNRRYLQLVSALLESCPVFSWQWIGFTAVSRAKTRTVSLTGSEPSLIATPEGLPSDARTGIYVQASVDGPFYDVSDLMRSDHEFRHFWLPNGGFTRSGEAEFIDYGSGQTMKREPEAFCIAPVPLPDSETHGLPGLDIQGNLFGNLPPMPSDYVHRHHLEEQLRELLVDLPYNAVTLHGRGGVGKTRLALHTIHSLAEREHPPFDHVAWFSARDVDLTPHGPKQVQPAMDDMENAAATYGRIFGLPGTVESLKAGLNGETEASRNTLFIFDNFETIADKRTFQRFLTDNTRPPNKLLITSRERDFHGDLPLEVSGMDWEEAQELLEGVGASLGIQALLTPEVMERIFESTEGHAYVMRLVAGEIASRGDVSGLSQVMTQRDQVLDAVFERSYARLSEAGRTTFLTVGNWKAIIPEVSLIATLGKRGFDVLEALDECSQLALIERGELKDGQPCFWAPQLARIFAQRKLTGATDALTIRGDLQELRKFGVISIGGPRPGYEEIMGEYSRYCLSQAREASPERRDSIAGMLERCAEYWPQAWLTLVEFRALSGASRELVLTTTQRAVEALPESKRAWEMRLRHAQSMRSDEIAVTAQIELANLDPADHAQLEKTATAVIKYVTDHKGEIPLSRRDSYVHSVRDHMTRQADSLRPNALRSLAWLYLIDGNDNRAWEFATLGKRRNSKHKGCNAILQRLEKSGFRPARSRPTPTQVSGRA